MSKPKIEAIYPLTFMQQSLLVHSLYEEQDQGFLQLQCTLKGSLELSLLQQAWQEVVQVHAALRTSIHWENIEKSVQIIHPKVTMPWDVEDWKDLSDKAKRVQLEERILSDHVRGLKLSKAPISRLILIKISDSKHILLWSCHHILLDGWSSAIILKDVFTCYDALCKGQDSKLEPVPSYRSYVSWLKRKDPQKAEIFWKESLSQYKRPALIGSQISSSNGSKSRFEDRKFLLSAETTLQLQAYVRKQHSTLNTLILALWGIILGRICNLNEVVFGATVSGRSGDFPHVERMAGLFMNVLPVRLSLDPNQQITKWLDSIHAQQFAARNFEHTSMDQITTWTNWPGHLPLFDSLVVVENFPWTNLQGGAIVMENFKGGFTTTYPMTVAATPGDQLEIMLRYDSNEVTAELTSWLGHQLLTLLEAAITGEKLSVDDLRKEIQDIKENHFHQHTAFDLNQTDNTSNYVAPKTPLELKLTKIWEEVFSRQPIGVDDNFFQIGGKSLLAVRLFSKIEQKLGRNLSPSTLLQHPTIAALAQAWDDESIRSTWSSLVPMRASGSMPPLFVVHAGGGHVFFYQSLAEHLDPNQPVYALQPLGLDGDEKKHDSIEKMASHYLEVIRQIQPEGPITILSYCFGNPVCLEMGIQMEQQGEAQCKLIIIDSAPGHLVRKQSTPLQRKMSRFKSRFRRNPFFAIWKMITGGLKNTIQLGAKKWDYLHKRYGSDKQARDLLITQENLIKLYFEYNWKPYDGKITLIRSKQKVNQPESKDVYVWDELALGGVEILEVPGTHETLFQEPDVVELAQCLQQHLNESVKQAVI